LTPTSRGHYENGAVAYRCLFTADQLAQLNEPGIQAIHKDQRGICRLWLGPKAHAVFYSVKVAQIYNLVLIVADHDFNNAHADSKNDLETVREFFRGWDLT
jgi:salicylate hydroxylase